MKLYCVKRNTFFVSADPHGKNMTKSSFVEREFFYVMSKLGPLQGNIFFRQTLQLQKQFDNQVLDAYCEKDGIGYLFHGCWEHGHFGCDIANKGTS